MQILVKKTGHVTSHQLKRLLKNKTERKSNEIIHDYLNYRIELQDEYIQQLQLQIEKLSDILSVYRSSDPDNTLIIDELDLTKDQIKEIILNKTKLGEIFYPSDIANNFGLDLVKVMDAISELKKEGKLSDLNK